MQNSTTEEQTINDLVKQRKWLTESKNKGVPQVEPRWAQLKTSIRGLHKDESF